VADHATVTPQSLVQTRNAICQNVFQFILSSFAMELRRDLPDPTLPVALRVSKSQDLKCTYKVEKNT
jgi:hypothetical protein